LAAENRLVSMAWYKHGFQRRRSNVNKEYMRFKGYGPIKLNKEFLNKGWRLLGRNKLSKKLQETGTAARRSFSIESIHNIFCFSIA